MGPVNLILTDTQTALCCELQPSVTRTYLLSLKGTAAQKGGVREDQRRKQTLESRVQSPALLAP